MSQRAAAMLKYCSSTTAWRGNVLSCSVEQACKERI